MTNAIMAAEEKARGYLRARGTEASPAAIHDSVAAAFTAFETLIDRVAAADAGRRTIPGEWSVQEIVDHLLETYRPGLDELWCLLAGQRPPEPPIPAGLQSKAPRLRPWLWLAEELRRLHHQILTVLRTVPTGFTSGARAPLIMVINVPGEGGTTPHHWIEELDWKSYVIVSWRLHTLDHLHQARRVLAAR